jgi:hypothetical protein
MTVFEMFHAIPISQLYDKFISKFEARVSQIRLASLVSVIGHSLDDPSRALAYFTSVLSADSRKRLGLEAALCIDMDVVLVKIKLQLIVEAATLLESSKVTLHSLKSTETVVFSKFYWSSAEYYKVSKT